MRRPTQDVTGRRFGQLLVLSQTRKEFRGKRQSVCLCRCDCGVEKEIPVSALCSADGTPKKGGTKSCGHTRTIGDITGQKFGRLTAVEPLPERNSAGEIVWRCRCDCGNEKNVSAPQLKSGYVISCGCALADRNRSISKAGAKASHTLEADAKRIQTMFGAPGSDARKQTGQRLRTELEKSGAVVGEMNIAKLASDRPDGTNPYRGVCWNRAKQRWMAYCQVGKKRWASARFRDPEEAKEARDKQLLLMLEAADAEQAIENWKTKKEQKNNE